PPLDGAAVRSVSIRYLATKARARSAASPLSKRLGARSEKTRFQIDQKKQNPTTRKGNPCSGSRALKSWHVAVNRVAISAADARFASIGDVSENQPPISISPDLTNIVMSIAAKMR